MSQLSAVYNTLDYVVIVKKQHLVLVAQLFSVSGGRLLRPEIRHHFNDIVVRWPESISRNGVRVVRIFVPVV